MPAKKKAKKTTEQRIEALKERIGRLRKKLASAAEGAKKRLARKKVKRTQRRKRALAPKPPKTTT